MHISLALLLCTTVMITIVAGTTFKSEKYPPPFWNNPNNYESLEEGTYKTQLDHFRPQNGKSIQFNYVMNRKFYTDGGPLLIYINDGVQFTTQWLQTGLMYDIAQNLSGALITSDHRYFRTNLPTENASYDNLQYLAMEQTLSDIAYLIREVKEKLEAPNAKVIVWGTAYGGTLAALAREKYPHLIDGAWSSSGIFALSPRTRATHLHLTQTIGSVNHGCEARIRNTFNRITYLIDHDGGKELQSLLNLCSPLQTESDLNVASFMESQFNYIADYISVYHRHGIENFCDDIMTDDEAVEALGKWITHVYGAACSNFTYDWSVERLKNVEWNQIGTLTGLRQWYYIKCTQVGLLEISSNSEDTIFGQLITQTYHYYGCRETFGSKYDYEAMYDSIDTFDTQFGNRDNYETTNVIFTNGLFDRWYPHALTNLIHNPHSLVINIPDYARSADLTSITNHDSEDLQSAKEGIIEWLTKFVNEATPGPKFV